MKFRRSAPAVLIGTTIVVVTGMAAISNALFSGLTEATEEGQFALMQSIVETGLRSAEGRAIARAAMIADLPRTRTLLAARDREGMLAEYAETWRVQHEQHGVDQMQFHVPPAVSFLRLHQPAQFGDDLSSFRPLVVAVNESRTASRGLSISRAGPAIFAVVPVHGDHGEHLGSFEIGIDFGGVLDDMKTSYDVELTVLILEEPLREVATGLDGEVLSDANRVGRYLKFHSTNWALMQSLVGSADVGYVVEPVRYTREALGATYGVLLLPIQNAGGQPLGVIAVARDFSGSRAAAGRSLVWQGLLALISIVMIAGMILIVIRGVLLRPLARINERFAELAAGKTDLPIDDVAELTDELRELARHHETLRTRSTTDEEAPS